MGELVEYLSVVIPAFEEVERLGPTLERVRAYLDHQSFESEVLVVVDGGRDGTLEMVRHLADSWPALRVLDNGVNRGKGYSVRRGMLEARGRYLLFSDADLSTPIADVERLIAALDGGADVAIGSRSLAESDVRIRQVWWRQSMGRVFNLIVRFVAVSGIHDTQCGFKCFQRQAARRIFNRQRLTRFSFDVELLWIARKLGHTVVEIPVTWENDPSSRVDPVMDSLRMLIDLMRLRYADLCGAYRDPDDAMN
jgi:dolichyl-phosphate beta-glucosyltransferase